LLKVVALRREICFRRQKVVMGQGVCSERSREQGEQEADFKFPSELFFNTFPWFHFLGDYIPAVASLAAPLVTSFTFPTDVCVHPGKRGVSPSLCACLQLEPL